MNEQCSNCPRLQEQFEKGQRFRIHLPVERQGATLRFQIGNEKGYVTVNPDQTGQPMEMFIRMAKVGSLERGLLEAVGKLVSFCLKSGIPVRELIDQLRYSHFEPAGLTGNKEIPSCSSVLDYIFRWVELRFLPAVESGDDNGHSSKTGTQADGPQESPR